MMKKVLFISSLFVASALAIGPQVFAEVTQPENGPAYQGSTDTTITVENNDAGPVDPTNPAANPNVIELKKVPDNFDFTTKLTTTGQYTISSGTISVPNNTIDVFNTSNKQDWQVKAAFNNFVLKRSGAEVPSSGVSISSFNMTVGSGTSTTLTGTGFGNTILQNTGTTEAGTIPTGLTSEAVQAISVSFTDPNFSIQAGDTVEGTINYTLTSTMTAG